MRLGIALLAVAFVSRSSAAAGPPTNSSTSPEDGAPASASASAASAGETLFLEVQINGHPTNKIGEFILRRGQLMARAEQLRDLGLRVPNTRASLLNGFVALSELSGVRWHLDQANQELFITATEDRLVPESITPFGAAEYQQRLSIQSGKGMTFNYDVVNSFSNRGDGASGSMDLVAFSPWGVASSGWLAYAGASATNGAERNRMIRLDTVYTFSDVNSLRRYSFGDFVNQALSWTRPVHMAGIQIRSDFSMRPDLVTFPLPTVKSSTSVPSTVTILADGNLVASSQVGAGPFQVSQLPVVSGAGTISMTVTNALGQQVTLTQPFYASSQMLAHGLQTFSGELGLVRRDWGSASNDYGKVAASILYRRGLSEKFTIEGSAQGTPGAVLAGAGGVLQVANLGVVNLALSGSAANEGGGLQVSGGAQRIGRTFSLGGNASIATRMYSDIASMNGDGIQRKLFSAFASLYSRRLGSLGLAYSGIDQDAPLKPIPDGTHSPLHTRVLSGTYSYPLRHMVFYASEFRDFENSGDSGIQAGVTIPFGRRSSVDFSGSSDGNVQVQAQQSAAEIGQWGYQAYASAGSANHLFGQVQYKSPVGLFTAGVDENDGQATVQLESQGAFSLVDRALFSSNTIYDSFAIVDTNPIPHVRVLEENRNVGRTNRSGRLLVPDMRSFELNHIAVKLADIPADAALADPSREIRPQDHSGVVVKFPILFTRSALLRLVDQTGKPIPVGSTAVLQSTGVAVPVGYDGEAYVESLTQHNNVVLVEKTDGSHCRVTFDYRPVAGDIPSIGPLHCMEHQP